MPPDLLEAYSTVAYFRRRYGGDAEELTSAAEELYVKACLTHDPKRGGFAKWVRWCVWNGLLEQVRKAAKRERLLRRNEMPDELPQRERWSLPAFLADLSREAVEVVTYVLGEPSPRADRRRNAVVRKLLRRGWKGTAILRVFREIRESLL